MTTPGTPDRSFSRRRLLNSSAASAVALGVPLALSGPAAAAEATRKGGASLPGKSRVVLLGTLGAPPPSPDAQGIATALAVGDRVYQVDCGRGTVSQYLRAGLKLCELSGIFLTHLHADHVIDYYDFVLLGGFGPDHGQDTIGERIPVHGPGPAGALPPAGPGVGTVAPQDPTPGIKALTDHQLSAFAYQTNIFMRTSRSRDPRTLLDVHEVAVPADAGADPLHNTAPLMDPFPVMDDGTVRVSAVLVPHGPVFPSFAYRFDTPHGSVVFSGDTRLSENVERLARGADILVHEAIDLEAEAAAGSSEELVRRLAESHTSVDDLGPLAQRAGVGTLVLTHLMPDGVPARTWHRRASRGFDGRVVVGSDLTEVALPGTPG